MKRENGLWQRADWGAEEEKPKTPIG